MIAVILAPFFFGLQIFELIRFIKYIKSSALSQKTFLCVLGGIVILGLPLCVVIGFLLPVGDAKRFFTVIGNYYLGACIYFYMSLTICDITRFIVHKIRKEKYNLKRARIISFNVVAIFTLVCSIIGIVQAHAIVVNTYDVTINKEKNLDSLNIVFISDLHLGYNDGLVEMQQMVDEINALNPDIVIVGGDIFDNEFEAVEEPEVMANILASMESKYGTYAVLGNHDVQEKIFCGFTFTMSDEAEAKVSISDEMLRFIEDCKMELLYDEGVIIDDGFVLYGRPDYHKYNFGNTSRLSAEELVKTIDMSYPVICVDHAPTEVEELAAARIDMTLCGHTHDGQMWPANYISRILSLNAHGLKYFDDMINITSSGIGLFGPNMRLDTDAEIVQVKVTFKK